MYIVLLNYVRHQYCFSQNGVTLLPMAHALGCIEEDDEEWLEASLYELQGFACGSESVPSSAQEHIVAQPAVAMNAYYDPIALALSTMQELLHGEPPSDRDGICMFAGKLSMACDKLEVAADATTRVGLVGADTLHQLAWLLL